MAGRQGYGQDPGDEKKLWDSIRTEQYERVYLIKGPEQYLKQKYVALLEERVVPAGLETFNVHKLKGEDTSLSEISDCVEMLPVMSPRTLVLVHDFPFADLDEFGGKQMEQILSDLPETCVLVFWQDTAPVSAKKDWEKELMKAFRRAGMVCNLTARAGRDLVSFVMSEGKKRDRRIDSKTASYLIEYVGTDMANLLSELDKVCSTVDTEVRKADIDRVCIQSLDTTTFKMVNDIAENRFDSAYRSLTLLFDMRTEPVMIMGSLVAGYMDLYRAKVCKAEKKPCQSMIELFPAGYGTREKGFRAEKAYRNCDRYSMEQLRTALEILARADRKIKTRFDDSKIVFEQLLVELWEAFKKA